MSSPLRVFPRKFPDGGCPSERVRLCVFAVERLGAGAAVSSPEGLPDPVLLVGEGADA